MPRLAAVVAAAGALVTRHAAADEKTFFSVRSSAKPPSTPVLSQQEKGLWNLTSADLVDQAGGVVPPMSRATFAKLAPSREGWCPWCKDPELCSKMFLFVVARGRSGSTTMMNMVNFLPGVATWGENYMLTNWLMSLEGYIKRWSQADGASMVGQSRAMAHPPENFTRFSLDSQQLMWNLLQPPPQRMADNTVRGFKERRWNASNIEWVAKAFPCSRFIVNFRHDVDAQADDAIEVGWRRHGHFSRKNQVKGLKRRTMDIRRGVRALGERGFSLALEDYNVENFNRLARWLGSPCRFNHVVHLNFNGTLLAPEEACTDCLTCPLPGQQLPGVAQEHVDRSPLRGTDPHAKDFPHGQDEGGDKTVDELELELIDDELDYNEYEKGVNDANDDGDDDANVVADEDDDGDNDDADVVVGAKAGAGALVRADDESEDEADVAVDDDDDDDDDEDGDVDEQEA